MAHGGQAERSKWAVRDAKMRRAMVRHYSQALGKTGVAPAWCEEVRQIAFESGIDAADADSADQQVEDPEILDLLGASSANGDVRCGSSKLLSWAPPAHCSPRLGMTWDDPRLPHPLWSSQTCSLLLQNFFLRDPQPYCSPRLGTGWNGLHGSHPLWSRQTSQKL